MELGKCRLRGVLALMLLRESRRERLHGCSEKLRAIRLQRRGQHDDEERRDDGYRSLLLIAALALHAAVAAHGALDRGGRPVLARL